MYDITFKIRQNNVFIILLCYKIPLILTNDNDIFRQDIGDRMEIGLTDKGYKNVELRCGSESMNINVEVEDGFSGVIYTRGSFYDKKPPCFYDTGHKKRKEAFQIKIPFEKCKTLKEGNVYSNVLVLQHDEELIMPGDAAFNLECNFNKPRDISVAADLHSIASRITLIDADPSKQVKRDKSRTFESYTNSVIINPEVLKQRKEEL